MNKKDTPVILIGFLAFCVGAILGWNLDKIGSSESSKNQTSESTGQTRQLLSANDSLRNLRAQRSEVARRRSAIEMARNLPSSEIKDWLENRKFNFRSGFAMTLFREIAFERWSREMPAEFLTWIATNGGSDDDSYVAAVFKKHPETVREVLSSLKDPGQQSRLLDLLARHEPDLALSELKLLLTTSSIRDNSIQPVFEQLVKTRPAEMEELLGKLEGHHRASLERAIIKRDLENDFEGTLEQLFQTENGFEHVIGKYFYQNQKLIDHDALISHLKDFPPSWKSYLCESSHFLPKIIDSEEEFRSIAWEKAGFTETQTRKTTLNFMYGLIQNYKPMEAVSAISNYEFSETEKRGIFIVALQYGGQSEETLSKISASLSSDEDRAIFDKILENIPPSKSKSIDIPEDFIAAISAGSEVGSGHSMNSWKDEQKQKIANSFRNLNGAEKTRVAAFVATQSNHVDLDFKSEALNHLLTTDDLSSVPTWTEGNGATAITTASKHAVNLLNTDTAKATSWVSGLPEGEVKLQAQKNLAFNWRNYEPEAAQKWVESLPTSERAQVEEFLKNH